MWCYQKPGFEALLLAELQRQQQCSQFCDTLLKTEGVSVPAHSCILSALSPLFSSALSSAPPPPAGQSRLLEFRALGACTLLHMVRLLYCGEMAGEGENEKQEAISAAAKLGIHGLVEVTKRERESRNEEGEGRHAEVGVQTEPLMPEENEERQGRWRREVRDGSTFLWKETLSDGEKDTWTQTEELQVNTGLPSYPAASYETIDTIDVAALQSLGLTDYHRVPSEIPYLPMSLVYPVDENQAHQPSSALVVSMQESTAAGHTSAAVAVQPHSFARPHHFTFSSQAIPCTPDPQSFWADPQAAAGNVAAAEEQEDEHLEQFQGDIPGFISYFLKPEKEEGRGRARSRRKAGAGGARRAGTGERRARRPQARTGGRGRGGLTQMVDVQEVGVSRLQKLFLQRWGLRASMTGQGGGAAGRKLNLKTRELLKPTKRRRGKVWEFSQTGDLPPYSEGGGGTQRGRRSTKTESDQVGLPVGRAQRVRAKLTTSVPSSSTHLCNTQTLYAFTSLPPPPPEEHFERLLEEVMIDLDFLPNNNENSAPHSQPALPTSISSCVYSSCGSTLAQSHQQGRTTGLHEASPGFHGSTQVVPVARGAGSSGSANSEMPVLQQEGEGELDEMLDHFLQTFEQHVDSCTFKEEVETGDQRYTEASQPCTDLRKRRKTKTQSINTQKTRSARHSRITEPRQSDDAETPQTHSQPCKASARSIAPPKHSVEEVTTPSKQRKRVRARKTASSSNVKTKVVYDREDIQLQQMAVVKLERSGPLPATVTLHQLSCLEVKKPSKTKTSSSSVKYSGGGLSEKAQPVSSYPLSSWNREASITEPLLRRKRGRPRKNRQLVSPSNGEPSTPPQPTEPRGTDEHLEKIQERHKEELTVQPQEEAGGPTGRRDKRGPESEEETSDVATVAKRVCFEQMSQPTSETCMPSSESADFVSRPTTRELKDVPVVNHLQREQCKEEPVGSELKLRMTEESLVDGDRPTPSLSPSSHSAKEVSLGLTGSWEEDTDGNIDVIGGSSPPPDPVIINWTDSSEGEEEERDEDVDVVGEKTDCVSSTVYTTVSQGELFNRRYQTEVLLH